MKFEHFETLEVLIKTSIANSILIKNYYIWYF